MPIRHTSRNTGHLAQIGGSSKFTLGEMDHSGVITKMKKGNANHGESPTNVQVVQPYGMAYWVPKQTEQKQQGGGQQQGGGGGGGGDGGFNGMSHDQPKGPSGEGYMNFGQESRNHPYIQGIADPRNQLMLGDPEEQQGGQQGGGGGQQQEKRGGKEGDVAIYSTRDAQIQAHLHTGNEEGEGDDKTTAGYYVSTRQDKNKIRMQLVEPDEDEQQQQGQQSPTGGGGGNGGGQEQQSKDKGQRPLFKKKSETYMDLQKDIIHSRRGKGHSTIEDNAVHNYYEDEKISTMVHEKHVHMRFKGQRIWVDEEGCWTTKPIVVRDDPHDKSIHGGAAGAASVTASIHEVQVRWNGILNDPGRKEMATLLEKFSGLDIDEWVDKITTLDEMKIAFRSLLKAMART